MILKATSEGKIIGSVRAFKKESTCYIGRLIVHPDHQNRGIGAQLMKCIESYFGDCQRYELFTGKNSVKNIYLYNKLGFKIFREEQETEKPTMVFMEKFRL